MTRKKVAILISGRGSNMVALIEAAKEKDYPAEIVLVVSNQPDAAGIDYARRSGIAANIIDHKDYAKDREAFERALHATLESSGVEIVCLAGFMRLLTPWFVKKWEGRMLNIHPALLPEFKGLDTHARALAAGAKTHGATVHFVSADMDSGPIVCRAAVPVQQGDTPDALAARVLAVEHKIYPLALKWLAAGNLHVTGPQCRVTGAAIPSGVSVPDHG